MIVRLTHTARGAVCLKRIRGWRSQSRRPPLPGIAPRVPAAFPRRHRLSGKGTLGRRLCLPQLRRCGRTFPHRHPARRPDLPGLPPPDGLDRGHGDGAQSYAPQRLVLGGLPRRQPDARHVGGAVPAATWLDPLRDGFRHPAQAPRGHADQDRICGKADGHVEVDEAYVGGKTRGEGRGVHHKTLVVAAVEHREPGTAQDKRKGYAGRIRLAIATDRGAGSLGGFVESAVMPGTSPTTGAATVACGSKDMTITPLPNAATPRWPRSSCRSSTSSSVI